MDRKNFVETEKKLLKGLETKENTDGFYELTLYEHTKKENHQFSIKQLSLQFADNHFSKLLEAFYFKFIKKHTISSFKKEIQKLVQVSIQNKVLNGKASYFFIKNVAYISQESWMKEELVNPNASKKLKVLYFFKKFEKMFLDADVSSLAKSSKTRLLNEYKKYAKKSSQYIEKLLTDSQSINIQELIIFNALKNSF